MSTYTTLYRFFLWAPRVLTILFAAFISMFALDSFSQGVLLPALGGFFIHLIPVYLILLILWAAWKYAWAGTVGYFLLGLGYIYMAWDRFPSSTYFLISGPLFIVSVLFWVSWRLQQKTVVQ